MQEVHDHRAVLVDAEHGIPDAGVAVVLERQVFGAFDHRHAQALVDVVADEGLVVGQGREAPEEHEAADPEPDEQPVAHDPALLHRHEVFVLRLGGDVLFADVEQDRLQRLQAFADQDLVHQQIARDRRQGDDEHGRHRVDGQERDDVLEHRPDERPGAADEFPEPARAHRRRVGAIRLGDGGEEVLGDHRFARRPGIRVDPCTAGPALSRPPTSMRRAIASHRR